MNKINITKLELQMINRIARDDFTQVNGKYPLTIDDVGSIWLDVLIESNQDKGVLVSLHNKNLIEMVGGCDGGVWFTPAGFEVFQSNFKN